MKARILWAVIAMMGGLAGCASGSKTFLYATGPDDRAFALDARTDRAGYE